MQTETGNCQNCRQDFLIEPEDLDFYKRIEVPPPTWCPECRLIRRLMFRNERSLYRRQCDLCAINMFSVYGPEATFPIFCKDCWYSDKWSALDYGRDVDLSRPFFEQLKELWEVVPRIGVYNKNSTNSPFANSIVESKNVYLSYSVVRAENVMFSKSIDTSSDVVDSIESVGLQHCYENINSEKNYNCHFMYLSEDCVDSWFLYDCVNCRNCILSSNLQNAEYVIRNRQYSKEDYLAELSRMNMGSYSSLEKMKEDFREIKRKALHKYSDIKKSVASTGNHIQNAKNAKDCFETYDVENIKYCYRVLGMKDMHDVCYGGWSELRYEHITAGDNSFNIKFGTSNPGNLRNAEYVFACMASTDIFGCVGVNKCDNAILNKKYSPEEFQALRSKLISQMKEMPYVDAMGRKWTYGEFFPLEFAEPFGYNETHAQEVRPLSKERALAAGYAWRDMEDKAYIPTKRPEELPDSVQGSDDSLLKEVIGCMHEGSCDHLCTTAFRIIPDELAFYRRHGLPLPRLCPNCRHYERLAQMEPLKLWDGKCDCAGKASLNGAWQNSVPHPHGEGPCDNSFRTPYPPGHPETVYCEKCYQAEVA